MLAKVLGGLGCATAGLVMGASIGRAEMSWTRPLHPQDQEGPIVKWDWNWDRWVPRF